MIVSLLSSIYEKFSQVGNLCGARDCPASEIIDLPADSENQATTTEPASVLSYSQTQPVTIIISLNIVVSLREIFTLYWSLSIVTQFYQAITATFLEDNLNKVKTSL